jgi:hypothetical protein
MLHNKDLVHKVHQCLNFLTDMFSNFNDSNNMVLISAAFKLVYLLFKRPFLLIHSLCDATAVSPRRWRGHLDLSATLQATTHNFSYAVTFSGSEKKSLIVIVESPNTGLQIYHHG